MSAQGAGTGTPRPLRAQPVGDTLQAIPVEAGGVDRSVRPEASTAVPGYLPALDGLRAVAVATVVAYHLGLLHGGFLGVDVFFVVSGFLITRLLLAERGRTGRVSLRSFWARRFRRLIPALLVVVIATCIGSALWLPDWRLVDIRNDAFAALAYVANWHFIASGQSYFATGVVPSPLRHTWSLSIEEQFYLLWPLAVVATLAVFGRRSGRAMTVVCFGAAVVSAGAMWVAASGDADLTRLYFGTGTRAFALLAGAWLATWWDRADREAGSPAARHRRARRWALAGLAATVPLAVLLVIGNTADRSFYEGGFQAAAVLSVVVVAGAITGVGPLVTVFSRPSLVWIGRRSYGIYLWSWPIQVFASEHFELTGLALYLTVVALTVTCATISHWLVEEPVRLGRRPTGFPPRRASSTRRLAPAATWAVAVGVTLAVVTLSAVGAPEAPAFLDAEAQKIEVGPLTSEEEELLAIPSTVAQPDLPPGPFAAGADPVLDPHASVDPSLRLGRPLHVLVTGDSVAWSTAYKLQDDQTPTVDITDRGLLGCGLLPGDATFTIGSRAPEAYFPLCASATSIEVKELFAEPDVVVMWFGAWEVFDQEYHGQAYAVGSEELGALYEQQLQARIDRARSLGIPSVVVKVPCFGEQTAYYGEERTDPDRVSWVNDHLLAVVERNPGWARMIDPTDLLCDEAGNARPTTPAGGPLRQDGTHFDPTAAAWLWNSWLAGQLGASFADA